MTTDVRLIVGDWSTTIDSTSSYYHTIFSALDEIPSKLELGESWNWLPEQWSKWEILKERLERYGNSLPSYEEPVIHYKDIELIQRAFLDLPPEWPAFVVFDNIDDPVVKNYLKEVGSRIPIFDVQSIGSYAEVDTSHLTEQRWLDRVKHTGYRDKRREYRSFLEIWKGLGNYLGQLRKRYENERDYENVITLLPPIDEQMSWFMLGIWHNVAIQGAEYPHKLLPWDRLRDFYKSVPILSTTPYLDIYNAPETETVLFFTDGYDPNYEETSRINSTMRISVFFFLEDNMTLFPELYRKSLPFSERGELLWTNEFKWWLRDDSVDRWAEVVNKEIVDHALSIVDGSGSFKEKSSKVSYLLISVIGIKNAKTILKMIDDYVGRIGDYETLSLSNSYRELWLSRYSLTLESFREVVNTRQDLPEEMIDFSSTRSLNSHLEEVIKRY